MASNTQDDGAEPGSDVAEAVGKEYAFIHGLLSKVLKSTTDKKPILKRLCADDPRNRTPGTEEERCTCNSCGRTGVGNSEDISMSQLIDSASLIGLMYSMGTMVNSYFSTDCSRLQKQGKSSAALSHDSYVDIVHTKLKDISSDLLGVDKSDATESECDDNDEQMLLDCLKKANATNPHYKGGGDSDYESCDTDKEDFEHLYKVMVSRKHPSVPHSHSENDNTDDSHPTKHFGVPQIVATFDSCNIEHGLLRAHLAGGALHAQAMKYSSETPYRSQKDTIPQRYKKRECLCVKHISALMDT
uniref:Uncharacterized protein n=1 Tax=Chionoecetes opilio bacilliform virus TaxID=1825681 RepID=A0A1Q3DL27_9VIRU|nr:wsv133-like protein [Chionoecetes opilio bacilliform virus]GAV93171.1 hypothetical protein SCV_047 [Chionoecetes opilio bacilliform virus]